MMIPRTIKRITQNGTGGDVLVGVGGGPVTLHGTSMKSALVLRETVLGCWDVDNIGGNVGGNVPCSHGTLLVVVSPYQRKY